jgi:hypothetical protein
VKIPYVIDNVEHRLADVINAILRDQPGRQVDIATAYFSIRGYQQVRHTLPAAAGLRLLLGAEPRSAADVVLQPDSAAFLRHELNAEPLAEATQRLVEELIRFLRRREVQVRLFLGHAPDAPGRRAFLHAKCYLFYGGPAGQGAALNPLVGEVVVRRTRQFIRRAYPDAAIGGRRITWPERRLSTLRYDLEDTYEGFYRDIMRRIETLHLAHYNLESYKRPEEQPDEFELGREQALVGIFKSRFLKRLESSIEAFCISIARALAFAKTFAEYLQDDIVLDSSSFQTALRLLASDEEDADAANGDLPASLADEIDASEEARQLIAPLPAASSSTSLRPTPTAAASTSGVTTTRRGGRSWITATRSCSSSPAGRRRRASRRPTTS